MGGRGGSFGKVGVSKTTVNGGRCDTLLLVEVVLVVVIVSGDVADPRCEVSMLKGPRGGVDEHKNRRSLNHASFNLALKSDKKR